MNLPMSWDEWADHDGVALATRIAKGELTAAELAAQAAAAIARVDPALSGVVEVFEDAIANPATDGTNLDGPFAGLPFLMKDLGPTMKGRLQEMGSRYMRGNRATADTFMTAKMREAGLNLIGRTTTPEFGVCSSADNPDVYVTRNPWNTDYTTCGSSAGSAAMVAAGAVPIAHATDGGGSIRIPAGVNGNIGLKVSRGVFSLSPLLSDLSGLVSIQGCQSRTVRDTAAFVDACRGPAPGEFMPFWSPPEPYTRMITRDPAPLRIALSHQWGEYARRRISRPSCRTVGRFLEGLGHHVDYALPAIDYRAAFAAQTTCYISNFAVVISNMLAARGLEQAAGRSDRADQHPDLGARPATPVTPIAHGCRRCSTRPRAASARSSRTGTSSSPRSRRCRRRRSAPRSISRSATTLDVLDWFGNLWRNFAFTPLANLCGIPAISLPLATHEHGLPLGIQAIARQANDGLLLQFAAQIERAIDGKWNAGERPGVHVTRG